MFCSYRLSRYLNILNNEIDKTFAAWLSFSLQIRHTNVTISQTFDYFNPSWYQTVYKRIKMNINFDNCYVPLKILRVGLIRSRGCMFKCIHQLERAFVVWILTHQGLGIWIDVICFSNIYGIKICTDCHMLFIILSYYAYIQCK